ncbi:MAG: hypothetical protein ACREJM_01400, partial [Candidatus Saccharimonadales bacterium]
MHDGIIVAGESDKPTVTAFGKGGTHTEAIPPHPRRDSVPITEPRFIKRGSKLAEPITDPLSARAIVQKVSQGQAGSLFLDTRHAPIAFVPIDVSAMEHLRGGQLGAILQKIGEHSPSAAIVNLGDDLPVNFVRRVSRNLTGMLNAANVRALDVFHGNQSLADFIGGQDFHSEAPRADGIKNSAKDVRVRLKKAVGQSKIDRLEQSGLLKIHDKAAEIPGAPRSQGSGIQGYYDGKTMHLAADGIQSGHELGVLLHEAVHGSGRGSGSLKQILGTHFDDLDAQFQRLLDGGDKAAARAQMRVPADTPDADVKEERLAYLVEDVANAGAATRATTFSGPVIDLARRVYNALRSKFYASKFYGVAQKLGVKMDLSPRDLAALARQSLDRMAKGADKPTAVPGYASKAQPEVEPSMFSKADEGAQVAEESPNIGEQLRRVLSAHTPNPVKTLLSGVHGVLTPISAGDAETAAIAKDYANETRASLVKLNDRVDWLRKNFTHAQRQKIWEATSAENVARVRGEAPPKDGFASLTPEERNAADLLQKENAPVAQAAVKLGIL